MSTLVSIVMPAFAAERTIAAAVASVTAQSHREWELLLVADDGRDYGGLLEEAGIADARIRLLASRHPGSGPAAARNLGQRHATGTLVTRLDADDLYEPERLERLVPLALAHGVAGDNAVAFDERRGGALGTVLPPSEAIVPLQPYDVMLSPVPWCLVFRRELLPQWDETLRFAEDVLFNAGAFEHLERLPTLAKPLWRYRVMASSLSHRKGAVALAEATYRHLIAECDGGKQRFGKPALAAVWRRALEAKRALNSAYRAAHAAGTAASFQEFVLKRARAAG